VPTATYSAHWLRHPGLHAAIVDFCARERVAVEAQMAELDGFGPYRADEP
jgi:predicted N-acyltransferase